MLKVENIKKSFGTKVVLDGVSLEIQTGEVYGLIGENGAGKSTLFNIISQILACDEGSVFVDGKKIEKITDLTSNIGYVFDNPAMYEYMNALEYLMYLSCTLDKTQQEKIDFCKQILEKVGLLDVDNKKIKKFSKGMKQRLSIASALVASPKVILMDEPTSALDPLGRSEVMEIIKMLKQQNKTIILSTHILGDIEKICDKMGFLVNGKIQVSGNIVDILRSYSENKFIVEFESIESKTSAVKKLESLDIEVVNDNTIKVLFEEKTKQSVFDKICKCKNIFSINTSVSTVEELFIKIGKGAK